MREFEKFKQNLISLNTGHVAENSVSYLNKPNMMDLYLW